jgi:hypothetical protein
MTSNRAVTQLDAASPPLKQWLDLGLHSEVYRRRNDRHYQGARLAGRRVGSEAGIGRDMVRYYERDGPSPAPQRTASGYREHDPAAVDRLLFIQGAQSWVFGARDPRSSGRW